MRNKFFNNLNPFKRKNPTDQLISTLTESVTTMFQNQMNDTMASAMSSMSREMPLNNHKTERDDAAEQNRIYANAVAMTNGNRDDTHRVPDTIIINSFKGDKMPPEQRQDAQDIIDTINEANEINRTGTYRTEDTVIEENCEPTKVGGFVADMLQGIGDFFTPIARSVAACLGAVISIIILMRMTKMVESFG